MVPWTLLLVALGAVVTSSDALKVVYTRAYTGKDLGAARSYHAQYWQIARKSGYYILTHWSTTFPCANYEANVYGDYMGFFSCNQYFEPYSFQYCCGKQGAHYCCPNSSLATPYRSDPGTNSLGLQGWIVGVIVLVVLTLTLPVFGVLIYCCVAGCCLAKAANRRPTTNANRNTQVVTVTSGAYPTQPQTGAYPMQPSSGMPYPPPGQEPTGGYGNPMMQPTGAPGAHYSQPSDYGFSAGQGADPPPAYATVTQRT